MYKATNINNKKVNIKRVPCKKTEMLKFNCGKFYQAAATK